MVGGSTGTCVVAAGRYAERLRGGGNVVALAPDNGRNYLTKIFSDRWMQEHGLWEGASRQRVTGTDAAVSLSISQRVSSGLVAILDAVSTRPRYLVAKGGITASDVATQALGVKRASVPGQILPGVPVWELGSESRYPGLAYVVFPGNVGEPDSLARVAAALKA